MFDENYEVHPEIAAAIPKGEVVEQQQEQVVEKQAEPEKAPEPQKESLAKSWRELRLAREKAERERDEAIRLLHQQQKPQYQEQAQPEPTVGESDFVVGKDLKAYQQQIKKLEEQQRIQHQMYQVELSKSRLKQKYPDFESVVNQDTIEMLNVLQPEVARTLDSSNDMYAAGVTAYTLIKNMGIQPSDTYKEDVQRIQRNANKPKPLASISPQQGESPLSNANAFANGLTDELRRSLQKEMNDARKNL